MLTAVTGTTSTHESVSLFLSLQMNDYMAAYHDAVLLIGQVMREIVEKNNSEIQQMEFVNVNYFRNISFNGKEGGRHSQRTGWRRDDS